MEKIQPLTDCVHYTCGKNSCNEKCTILKKLYCAEEDSCVWYKEKEKEECVNTGHMRQYGADVTRVILVLGLCVLIMLGLLIIAMGENERQSAQICELRHNIREYEILTDTLKSELKEIRE